MTERRAMEWLVPREPLLDLLKGSPSPTRYPHDIEAQGWTTITAPDQGNPRMAVTRANRKAGYELGNHINCRHITTSAAASLQIRSRDIHDWLKFSKAPTVTMAIDEDQGELTITDNPCRAHFRGQPPHPGIGSYAVTGDHSFQMRARVLYQMLRQITAQADTDALVTLEFAPGQIIFSAGLNYAVQVEYNYADDNADFGLRAPVLRQPAIATEHYPAFAAVKALESQLRRFMREDACYIVEIATAAETRTVEFRMPDNTIFRLPQAFQRSAAPPMPPQRLSLLMGDEPAALRIVAAPDNIHGKLKPFKGADMRLTVEREEPGEITRLTLKSADHECDIPFALSTPGAMSRVVNAAELAAAIVPYTQTGAKARRLPYQQRIAIDIHNGALRIVPDLPHLPGAAMTHNADIFWPASLVPARAAGDLAYDAAMRSQHNLNEDLWRANHQLSYQRSALQTAKDNLAAAEGDAEQSRERIQSIAADCPANQIASANQRLTEIDAEIARRHIASSSLRHSAPAAPAPRPQSIDLEYA